MADEDDSEKTEEPSGKKLSDARKKGQFAKTMEFNILTVLFFGYGGFLVLSPSWGFEHQRFAELMFGLISSVDGPVQVEILNLVFTSMDHLWHLMGIPMILLWVLVVGFGMAHNRFVIPEESLKLDWKKADPITNAKEKYFSLKPIVEFVKSLLKLFLLGYIVWRVVGNQWVLLPSYIWIQPLEALGHLHGLVLSIFWGCMPMIITIAIFDFGYQWYDNRKKLMMSRQEIKEEMKNTEGNPEVKAQQKKLARQRLMNSIAQQVPKADVVVVNPTHFAVALRYDTSEADAPVVMAKGVDFLAMRIRLLADQNDIPIIENPPLARGLYFQSRQGQQIPPDFYAAVAEVLAVIYRRRNHRRSAPM